MASADKTFNEALGALHKNDIPEAERLLRKVVRAQPRHFEALNLLAVALMFLERHAEAEPQLKAALAIHGNNDATLSNYGVVLRTLKRPAEAFERFSQALAVNPGNALTWHNHASALHDLQRYEEAIASFERAVALDPRLFDAFGGMGNSLAQLKRYDEAFAAYDKALSLNPNMAGAWQGRGSVFFALRRYDEAFAAYDRAYALDPNLPEVEGLRLHAKMHLCDWSHFADEAGRLIRSVNGGKESASPFTFVSIGSSAAEQLRCARLWASTKHPAIGGAGRRTQAYVHDRIRVGYVSADFRAHATAYLMAGLFEAHDKSRFEITAVSTGPNDRSPMRERLERAFDRFIDAGNFGDAELAAQVARAEIDILVDLNGFTQNARTDLFARRPAPVQVNYLGYPGTMGAEYYDYIVADPVLIPAAQQDCYSEKIAYLPNSYQVNDAARAIAEKPVTRLEHGLPDEGFVFCCFNNSYKILPDVFDVWMRLLKQTGGSVLWLLDSNATAAGNLRKEAAARGVDPARLVFAGNLPLPEHLARHRLADLFIDTLPYNAHTTASDALWAGLPVLTQAGETFAGRVAASLLTAVGLPELVAPTRQDYERLALELASQPDRLAQLGARLAQNRLAMPLFDTPLFTRHLEYAYAAMADRARRGLRPDHIHVPA